MGFNILKGLGGLAAGGLGLGAATGNKKFGQGLLDFLLGSDKFKRTDAFTPEQMNVFRQQGDMLGGSGAYGQAFQNLQALLDPTDEGYDRFTEPYMQQFQQQILPGIAEKYAGMGALGSSGFGQALGAAGSQLQTGLAGLKAQLQRQAGQDIFGQYQGFLGQQPQYAYREQNQGMAGPLAQMFGRSYFGGGM